MSATKKEAGTSKTPMQRRDSIYARLKELQDDLEYRVNEGGEVGTVTAEIAQLREELPVVLNACENWDRLRRAQQKRVEADAYEQRAALVEKETEKWAEELLAMAADSLALERRHVALAAKIEKGTGLNGKAFGPRYFVGINATIKRARTFMRIITDTSEAVRKKGKETVELDDIRQIRELVEDIRAIPDAFRGQARQYRLTADVIFKGKGGKA